MGSRISCETGFVSKCCHTKARKPVIGFLVAEANCVAACRKSCVVHVERTGAESILFSLRKLSGRCELKAFHALLLVVVVVVVVVMVEVFLWRYTCGALSKKVK